MPWFNDWILVGNTDRPACRIKGDGSLVYLIEVPIFNDPCGLQRPNTNTFETVLSITRLQNVILDGDETVKIRCIYGPPAVGTPVIPEVPAPEAILPFTAILPPFEVTEKTANSNLSSWHVYLATAIILPLILALMICCSLYFCMKTRKSRLDSRRKFFHGSGVAPPGAKLSVDDIGRFWWTARSSASNDPLMSHNLMLVNQAVSKPVSVNSGDYANAAASNVSHTSSFSTPPGITRLSPQLLYVHDTARMRVKGYADSQADSAGTTWEHVSGMQKQAVLSEDVASSSIRDDRSSAMYTSIDCQKKTATKTAEVANYFDGASPCSSAETTTADLDPVSRLNVGLLTKELKRMNHRKNDVVLAPSTLVDTDPDDALLKEYINVINEVVMLRTVDLNEADAEKWAQAVRSDRDLQELLVTCRTYEDFKVISCISHYKQLFSREKWAHVVKILSHMALRRNKSQQPLDQSSRPVSSPTRPAEVSSLRATGTVGIAATAPSVAASSIKGTASSGFHSYNSSPMQRIFTRDSYCQVENEMQNVKDSVHSCLEKGAAELFECNSQFRV